MTKEGILRLHKTMLEEIGVDFFTPNTTLEMQWRDFLVEMQMLEETPGGPLRPSDIRSVIRRMKAENQNGAKWAIRLSNFLRDPEKFRDLVLESRRKIRTRPAGSERIVTQQIGAIQRQIELPANEAEQAHIRELVAKQADELRKKLRRS